MYKAYTTYTSASTTRTARHVSTGGHLRTEDEETIIEVTKNIIKGVAEEQYENRMTLQRVMVRNGFEPIDCEWWHFTLRDEPYPDTYFEFPVSADYLKR